MSSEKSFWPGERGLCDCDMREELEFYEECQKKARVKGLHLIPPENITLGIDFEKFKTDYLMDSDNNIENKNNNNDNDVWDLWLTGLHPPELLEEHHPQIIQTNTITQTITKTIIKYKYQPSNNNNNNNQHEPPNKKQKTSSSDWKRASGKSMTDNNNNNNKNKRQTNSKSKDGAAYKIPPGVECLFDENTGELIEELGNLSAPLVCQIGWELMTLSSQLNISFDSIAGLRAEKQKIKEVVIWPLRRKDLFVGLLQPPKGVLLFGPPGTGKTMIAKAIASESQANFFSCSPSSLTSKWIGESEKLVKSLFSIARYMAPSIIFIDEIDSLLTKRDGDGSGGGSSRSGARLATQFLIELQGVSNEQVNQQKYVLIIGATNRPQKIDEAARRRLTKRIYIPLPGAGGRKELIQNLLKNESNNLTDNDLNELVHKTDGYSGSDLNDLAQEAALCKVRELNEEKINIVSKNQLRAITKEDFQNALKICSPTVAKSELAHYIKWNKEFGAHL